MSNLTMDLTGTLANYSESNRVFRIFKYNQLVDFETTVFTDSIHVFMISGGVTTELEFGTDYVIPEEFINPCDNDMSAAKLMDPSFNADLCRGIKMLRGVSYGTTYTIAINYQRLYPNQLRTAYFHNEPLNITPELMLDVVTSIERLKLLSNNVADVTSVSAASSILLELDESKTNLNNYITEEEHLLNVAGGRFVIQPKGGSFYYDSVTVYHPASDETLTLGVDYFIVGMDEAKTKATSHTAPVYNFIMIVKPISDMVKVSYHAYGGDPTLDNYRELLKNINNITEYLNDAKTVTEDNLGSTELMTSLFNRIETLESEMRRLQGVPSYGDITAGKCVLLKLYTPTPGLHWYTIANLYNINGVGTVPCTADTFTFRLQTNISHIQFTASVSFDMNNNENDRVNVNVINENYPRGYIPFTDYSGAANIIQPQIRVVWNESDTVTGASLQLGFELKGMLEETVSIEDLSGHESCWKLVTETSTVTVPDDSDFLLPDNSSVWSSLLPSSKKEDMLVPFNKGHLAWCGTQSLNRPDEGWQYFEVSDELLIDHNTNIRKFTGLRLDIEEVGGYQFPIDIKFNSGTEALKGHATFTHQNNIAYINAEVYRDNGKIVIRLNYDIVAGITSNELNLKDMVILLN